VLIATSIYLACRQAGYPRTLKEIALVSGIPMKQIGRMSAKLLAAEGGEKKDHEDADENENSSISSSRRDDDAKVGVRQEREAAEEGEGGCRDGTSKRQKLTSPSTPARDEQRRDSAEKTSSRVLSSDLVHRIGSHVSLDSQLMDIARHSCDRIHQFALLSSVSPQCIAATVIICLAHVTGKRVDVKVVADVSQCSFVNITKTFSQLRPFVRSILPRDFVVARGEGIRGLPSDLGDMMA
jgi:transcription initiation factor TFIIIB Brf1 subunit/transcription initiation factor TFIIB